MIRLLARGRANAPPHALKGSMSSTLAIVAGRQHAAATQDRILDAAEALFMEHGFEATSLRLITAAAGVNLAAVNYHFGSKEELFQAVLTRRLDPMNQARVALLDRYEAQRAGPLACERILAALFIPALELARDPAARRQPISCACWAAPTPIRRRSSASSCRQQYAPMIARFKDAFARALPHLPRKELSWRLHFIMGALSYTLAGTDALKIIAELNPVETRQRRDPAAPPRAVPARGPDRAAARAFRRDRASSTTRCHRA